MKTQTGYTYIENGIPVISAERKPESRDFAKQKYSSTVNIAEYLKALKEWEKTPIPATNIFYCHLNKVWCITRPHPEYRWEFTAGQKVQHNQGEITKIL
ncbi:MAG TPA: hypothetical protein ENH85_02130 [Candidatus Scalindua sp.]|nr:hypothetical protein [Candidatus Scalindua sp.]